MGDDIPLAVLSDKSHVLYNYFKQRFAQVLECCVTCLPREGRVLVWGKFLPLTIDQVFDDMTLFSAVLGCKLITHRSSPLSGDQPPH